MCLAIVAGLATAGVVAAGRRATPTAATPAAARDDEPKPKADPPGLAGSIEGRILDLQGRPVAGATIRAVQVWSPREGDLGRWLDALRDRGRYPSNAQMTSTASKLASATGPDGRFHLDGIGPNQLAEVEVSSPAIATARLYVTGRDGADIRARVESFRGVDQVVYHARRFEYAAAPGKPIEGVVVDRDSGRPLAGIALRAAVFDESSLIPADGVQATTDAQGHYRLDGLPPAPAYRIFAEPAAGMPYPGATLQTLGVTPAFEPLRFDFALKRGILLRGRVTDRATGRAVSGYVDVYAFADNPHVGDYPGYRSSRRHNAPVRDGRFEAVALPDRGVIGFRADRERGGTLPGISRRRGHRRVQLQELRLPDRAVLLQRAKLPRRRRAPARPIGRDGERGPPG